MKKSIQNLCIFEDTGAENFSPLCLSRPVFDLRCGIRTLEEKLRRALPATHVFYHVRSYLSGILQVSKRFPLPNEKKAQECVFVNGRNLIDQVTAKKISALPADTLLYSGEILIAARLSSQTLHLVQSGEPFTLKPNKLPRQQAKTTVLQYLWDIVSKNTEELIKDARLFPIGSIQGSVHDGVHFMHKPEIFVAKGATVKPGVVLDASDGPIIIDEGAEIMPHATLLGPVYIGKNSKVKVGAKIYEGVTVGPVCKVGGELETSIIHGFSNKQHEGFLGHAYIGEWCNLGADTNNSDLKNNYSSVDVIMQGEKIDTGLTFVGLFMGDHSKSGINTMFNTGTVVGFCSNVYGAGYLPKYIPSFSWFDAQKGAQTYKMEKAIEVATRVMARRKVRFSATDKKLFHDIFHLTTKERPNE